MQIEEVMRSPGDYYSTPGELIADPQWSRDQRFEILQSWKQYLSQLSVATEENMPGSDRGGAELLSLVCTALNDIEQADDTMVASPGPTKAG